jgi:hypothetical protein
MTLSNQIHFRLKHWCPPVWMVKTKIHLFSLFSFRKYPLADKANCLSCDPLFIISSGRSGTTLLRSMLVASGEIAIPPETQLIHKLPARFQIHQRNGWKEAVKYVLSEFEGHQHFLLWKTNLAVVYREIFELSKNERSLARVIDFVYQTYAAQQFPNAILWGDQSPLYTFFLPTILSIFPNARFVHLLRDGRDVVASFIEKDGIDTIDEAIYRWGQSIKRVRKAQKKIASNRFLEIRYEDLVTKPEEELRRISTFLNIEYTSRMLDYWKLDSTVESKAHSYHRNLEKPVFKSSIGGWKKRLSAAQQRTVQNKLKIVLR